MEETVLERKADSKLQALEETLMEASEGEAKAVSQLVDFLSRSSGISFSEIPEETRNAWIEGIELLVDNWTGGITADLIELSMKLAERDFDSSSFRDFLARAMRTEFSASIDPAGIITATGVYDKSVPIKQIAERWQRLRLLNTGNRCYHPHHGKGVIREVDELAHEVKAEFARELVLKLDVAVKNFTFVIPDSPLDKLMSGTKLADINEMCTGIPLDVLQSSCVPKAATTEPMKSFLVPSVFSEHEFNAMVERPCENGQNTAENNWNNTEKQDVRKTSRPQLRSLTEIKMQLQQGGIQEEDESTFADLRKLLTQACKRKKSSDEFVESLAMLHKNLDNRERIVQILNEAGFADLVRDRQADFIKRLPKFSSTVAENWLAVYCRTADITDFADLCISLPLNLLTIGEKVAAADPEVLNALHEKSLESIKKRTANCDIYLWLWNRNGEDPPELKNPAFLFTVLGRNTSGVYQQAGKELKKLLLDNGAFQDFLTDSGDPDTAFELVATARHSRALGSADRQTLTVRLAERYPALKEMIQKEHSGTVTRKKTAPVTSKRSYEQRRKELQDIINIHIPANSKAIAEARSHGDLRENAEYKAAKEEQSVLYAKRENLEKDLAIVQAADFRSIAVEDTVIPGSQVVLESKDGTSIAYNLLGLWDSAPEDNCISYDTPFGKILLGAFKGDEITLPSGQTATVKDITQLPEHILERLD